MPTSTLVDILSFRDHHDQLLIKPGPVFVKYMRRKFYGKLLREGVIEYKGNIFETPSAFCSYVIREVQSAQMVRTRARPTCDGWLLVYYVQENGLEITLDSIRRGFNLPIKKIGIKKADLRRIREKYKEMREDEENKNKEKRELREDISRLLAFERDKNGRLLDSSIQSVVTNQQLALITRRKLVGVFGKVLDAITRGTNLRTAMEQLMKTINKYVQKIEHKLNAEGITTIIKEIRTVEDLLEKNVLEKAFPIPEIAYGNYAGVTELENYVKGFDRTRKTLRRVKEELKALNRGYWYQTEKLEKLSAEITGKKRKKRKREGGESAGGGGYTSSRRLLTTGVQSLKL